ACPEIRELDLNPLVITKDGLVAIDARVIVGRPSRAERCLLASAGRNAARRLGRGVGCDRPASRVAARPASRPASSAASPAPSKPASATCDLEQAHATKMQATARSWR